MYAWCMRAAGWAVAEAADGFEALTVAATFEPDAVVMDLYLPVLGGVDAIRRLRSEMADRDLTIVACSGVPRADLQDEALDAGCDAFVAKPCLPDDMCDLLEELVLARARSR
jgi:CheY-like chemotaxis protein